MLRAVSERIDPPLDPWNEWWTILLLNKLRLDGFSGENVIVRTVGWFLLTLASSSVGNCLFEKRLLCFPHLSTHMPQVNKWIQDDGRYVLVPQRCISFLFIMVISLKEHSNNIGLVNLMSRLRTHDWKLCSAINIKKRSLGVTTYYQRSPQITIRAWCS